MEKGFWPWYEISSADGKGSVTNLPDNQVPQSNLALLACNRKQNLMISFLKWHASTMVIKNQLNMLSVNIG